MDLALDDRLRDLQAEAEAVAADAVARYGSVHDSWMCGFSREFSRELGARGWLGMTWPVEHGGGGRSPIERLLVTEALIVAGAPVAASWFADRQMGPSIIAYGTPEQQAEHLPPMLAGESTWCIGMSEPDSGSDLASLTTRAVRDGDEWVVDGRKVWTSFAHQADHCYLICRTDAVAGRPHLGISEIIVPMDAPGIEVRPIRDLTGAEHFNEVLFDGVRVPVGNLVGVEGQAFAQTMRQLEHERGGIDRLVSNRRLLLWALERADRDDPRVRQEIARLETGYRLGRSMVVRGALGQAPTGFSAATKCLCTEYEQRVAEFVARVAGAEAMLWGELAIGLAYAPAYTIMGGTSNVMRNILAERTLGLPR
jgi:alkylation response protein AidB-like acyl-CoA dehydrogenase